MFLSRSPLTAHSPVLGRIRLGGRCLRERAVTIVEVAVGTALLGLVSASALATLMILNKNSVSTRLMTNVREVVQRNIETAIGVPFSSGNAPPILAITSANGTTWDDGTGNPVPIYKSRDWDDTTNAGTLKLTGTLTRIVTAEPNTPGADIRRVTFRVDYLLYGRALSYQLTTIRAMDK